jgi:hypothetical protein
MASKSVQIVNLLLRKQNAGKLDWESTETIGEFQVAFPDFAIRIAKEPNVIVIRIFNAEGLFLERFDDEDIQNELENSYSVMQDLYSSARRAALKVDDTLDSIISELEDL